MSSMAYTKLREDVFSTLTVNAGVLLANFNPTTGAMLKSDIIGATNGGLNFQATPSFKDFGEDIDNCPKKTKELMRLDDWDIKVSGTFLTADTSAARKLMALADISTTKITPRDTVDADNDFFDLWLVCDYGTVNTGSTPGRVAIHMMNAMSTGGFQLQTTDKEKGKYSFEFTAHYSIDAQETVPFEVYIVEGTSSSAVPGIRFADKVVYVVKDATKQLVLSHLSPAGQTVTYSSSATTYATVNSSTGVVTGEAAGSSIVTASITVDGVTYSDTCTVIVTAS